MLFSAIDLSGLEKLIDISPLKETVPIPSKEITQMHTQTHVVWVYVCIPQRKEIFHLWIRKLENLRLNTLPKDIARQG